MYKRKTQGWLKHLDFILLDVLALQAAFFLAYLIRHDSDRLPYARPEYRILVIMYVVLDILAAAMFNTMHNVMKRGYYEEFVQTVKQVFLVLVAMALFLFSIQGGSTYSRFTIFLTSGFHLMIGYGIRLIWKKAIIKWGNSGTKATMILVAEEQKVGEIISRLKDTDYYEYVGIVLSNRNGTGEELFGVKVVASLETAADYICRSWVDEVFVYPASLSGMELSAYESIEKFMEDSFDVFTGNNYAEYYEKEKEDKQQIKIEGVSDLISACREMSIPVHICLPIIKNSGKSLIQKVGGYNVLTKTSNYASPLQLAMKRMIDIIGGIAGSLIAIVIIAVTGHKIKKESPGPILFKQTRIGLNGKKFQIYKIRTMYMDAEEKKKELLDHNRVSDGLMFKLDWDPRVIGNRIIDGKQVTGIGEKLRSGSWDEWPQFFNVLIGQMSLVGTRPPTVDEWEKYKYHHRARMSMKPGITGMWQVSGRSKITDFEEVVKLDTEYINHWSIGLDFRILAKTIQVVLKKEGAL